MIELDIIQSEFSEDIDAVICYASELYEKHFMQYFSEQRELFQRLKSKDRPISDSELEQILTTLPLDLFTVSEVLSQFKIRKETVTLKVKQKEAEEISKSEQKTITAKKEDAALRILEHKLLLTVYSAVIARVEKEIEFSRELIMSAKKIWDARKRTEFSNPVSPVAVDTDNLPDYSREATTSAYNKQTAMSNQPYTRTYVR